MIISKHTKYLSDKFKLFFFITMFRGSELEVGKVGICLADFKHEISDDLQKLKVLSDPSLSETIQNLSAVCLLLNQITKALQKKTLKSMLIEEL